MNKYERTLVEKEADLAMSPVGCQSLPNHSSQIHALPTEHSHLNKSQNQLQNKLWDLFFRINHRTLYLPLRKATTTPVHN